MPKPEKMKWPFCQKKSDFFEAKGNGKGSLFENVTDILYIPNTRFFTDHWSFLFRETGKLPHGL